jgi:hypothetical protein
MNNTLISIVCVLATASICQAQPTDHWGAFDANKDNVLNMAEFGKYRSEQYVELDINLDGVWTRSEFVKRPSHLKHLRPDDLRAKFKRWDKNKDGLWTIEEAEMAIEGNFRWLDKNKSKSISIDEMPPKF